MYIEPRVLIKYTLSFCGDIFGLRMGVTFLSVKTFTVTVSTI